MDERPGSLAELLDPLDRHGERPALVRVGHDGLETLGYRELSQRVARQAAGAAQQGLEPGDVVVLFAQSGFVWIEACLALLRARAVPVPLDTQLEREDLEGILGDCGARWILVDRRSLARLEGIEYDARLVLLDAPDPAGGEDGEEKQESEEHAGGDAGGEDASGQAAAALEEAGRWWEWACPPEALPGPPEADDRAVLFYTSGTTGAPKGVPLAQRHLAYQVEVLREASLVRDDDRLLLPLPLHHVYPLVVGLFAPLALGLTIVLPAALTGPQLLRALQEGEASVLIGVPRIFQALVDGVEQRIAARGAGLGTGLRFAIALCTRARRVLGLDLGRSLLRPLRARIGPRLRLLVSGGSALSPELGWKLRGLGFEVASGYGLTETAPLLTLNPPDSPKLESAGRPVRGVEIRIDRSAHPERAEEEGEDEAAEDEAQGQAQEEAQEQADEGEILVRGPGVFNGYLNREEKTRESFTQEGWLRTGDLGHVDDSGHLFVSGRKGTLILSSAGEKIRTETLEEAYARDPFIEEIGVLWDEDALAAVVVPDRRAIRREQLEPEKAIRQALERVGASMPSFQRITRPVVCESPLDRTRLGKIRRHRLRERYASLREGGGEGGGEQGSETERTRKRPMPVEEMSAADQQLLAEPRVREVWDLLAERYDDRGLSPDSDPKVDLGLDSLGWLDLSVEIADRTGVELEEERLLAARRVRDLLEAVSQASPHSGESDAGGRRSKPIEQPEAVLDERQQRWLAPLHPAAAALARGLSRLNRWLVRAVFGLEVEGVEHVPREGPVVIAPNHTSYLDPPVVAAALPESIRERTVWGGWTGIAFKNRFYRGISRLMRAVPVDPDRATASSLAFAAIVLDRGGHLVWFPEGQRSADGRLRELRPGLGRLAESRDEVAIVPVHIEGSHEAWPVGRRLPRRARIRVRFGPPEKPAALAERGEGDSPSARITQGLHDALRALAEGEGDAESGIDVEGEREREAEADT